MNDKIVVLSDIHGNLSALKAVIGDVENSLYNPNYVVLLGDIVNYALRPNEVIKELESLSRRYDILVNLFGNHEKALFDGDTSHFSTDRGRNVLQYTKTRLSTESKNYLLAHLSRSGIHEMNICGKQVLFVHGSLTDHFWGKMTDEEMSKQIYAKYDYVISGHSHIPNFTEKFYEDKSKFEYRNKKRTVFLNPGSVGQPRNHNPKAQYLFVDIETEIFHFNTVKYDVEYEQSLYEGTNIDSFYKTRLTNGI